MGLSFKLPFIYFVAVLCVIVACHSADRQNRGQEPILESQPFAAISDSIRRFPGDALLYLRRADLLSRNNAHEIAFLDYRKAWELAPGETTGMRYASSLKIIGKPDEAIKILKDCVRRFPANRDFKRLLGESFISAGRPSEATSIYDSLLKKDSADFESWYEKALLLEQAKDSTGAILALKKAYAIKPVNTYALELAHLYAENKNSQALRLCDLVISQDSSYQLVDAFFIKGIYYSNTAQYANAVVQFDSCIRRDWKFTDAYIEKGIVFFKQKNYDEALHTFRMASTVSNTNPDAYYWTGRCYEAIHKKEDAILNYQRALLLDKRFTEAREALKRVGR